MSSMDHQLMMMMTAVVGHASFSLNLLGLVYKVYAAVKRTFTMPFRRLLFYDESVAVFKQLAELTLA